MTITRLFLSSFWFHAAVYDGGDCCECTCVNGVKHNCVQGKFDCLDPDADCTDDSSLAGNDVFIRCTLGNQVFVEGRRELMHVGAGNCSGV